MTRNERLALLGDALQLSLEGMAALADLAPDALMPLAEGDIESDDALTAAGAISDRFGLKPQSLLREGVPAPLRPVSAAWQHLDADAQAAVAAQARLWLEDRLDIDAMYAPIEPPAIFDLPDGFPASADEDVDASADRLRLALGLGERQRITHLSNLVDELGIRIGVLRGADGFDACALISEDDLGIPMIVSSALISGDVQRAAIARELAYFVIDNPSAEAAAQWGRALLLPATVLRARLGETRQKLELLELQLLGQQYGLPVRQVLLRAAEAGIISIAYYARFNGSLDDREGWEDGGEPSSAYPTDTPELPVIQVVQLVGQGIISKEQAAALLGAPSWEALEDAFTDFE